MSFDSDPIKASVRLHALLLEREVTIAVAESCTGGMLAAHLTANPGASRYFLGGVVAYANATKTALLSISENTLIDKGAVSRATALAMAEAVRSTLGADYGLATTGIAGPGGGSETVPVGMVWGAISMKMAPPQVWLMLLQGERKEVVDKACFYLFNRLAFLL